MEESAEAEMEEVAMVGGVRVEVVRVVEAVAAMVEVGLVEAVRAAEEEVAVVAAVEGVGAYTVMEVAMMAGALMVATQVEEMVLAKVEEATAAVIRADEREVGVQREVYGPW